MARGGKPRGDRDTIRATRCGAFGVSLGYMRSVERLELTQIHSFNVPADAAFGEGKGHPGFEMRDYLGLHLMMAIEVIIQAVRPCDHQFLQPQRTTLIVALQVFCVDKQALAQIAEDIRLTLGLAEPAQGHHIVSLYAWKVILSLCVESAEDCVCVGLSVDMSNSPLVPDDADAACLMLPAFALGRVCCQRGRYHRQQEQKAHQSSGHELPRRPSYSLLRVLATILLSLARSRYAARPLATAVGRGNFRPTGDILDFMMIAALSA